MFFILPAPRIESVKSIFRFLIISNILRGLPGFYIESGNKNNIPTLVISHGTVSKAFNEKDAIYKKIIAGKTFLEKPTKKKMENG